MSLSDSIRTVLREIRPNALWDVIKWIVGGVVVIIGTLAALFWRYWQAITPDFKAVFVVGLLWFIGIPVIYLIYKSWRSRQTTKAGITENRNETNELIRLNAENQRLKNDLETLNAEHLNQGNRYQNLYEANEHLIKENQHRLDGLKEWHVEEVANLRSALDLAVAENEEMVKRDGWLIESAQMQREAIDNYVVLERFLFCRIATDTVPTLVLVAEIRNYSFFLVELDNNVSGYIDFDNLALRGEKHFNDHSSLEIPPTKLGRVTIEIPITREEQRFIESFHTTTKIATERAFKIHRLILTVKGADESTNIAPKRIRISEGFKVISDQAYEEAKQQFS